MTTRKATKKTPVHVHYPTVYAARHDAERGEWSIPSNQEKAQSHITSTQEHFVGAPGGAVGVMDRIVNGYPEGVRMVEEFVTPLRASLPRAVGIGRRLIRGDTGDHLDIHAVNRGAVDKAWAQSKRLIRPGRSSITLAVDICANAGTSSDKLAWRGIAALAVAEIMGKAGYNVEIIAGIAANAHGNKTIPVVITTTIKPRQGFTDVSLLSAVVCSSGYFRTIGFASIIRAVDNAGITSESGVGDAVALSQYLPANDKVSQIVVPNIVDSKTTATEWAKQTIQLLQGAKS